MMGSLSTLTALWTVSLRQDVGQYSKVAPGEGRGRGAAGKCCCRGGERVGCCDWDMGTQI